MYLLLGVAIALVYIILTNKSRQKKQKAKKKQEVPVGRQPIVPYRYSSDRSEQEDQESGMAMLSADKQEALAALAARKPGEEADAAVLAVDAAQVDAAPEADSVLDAEPAIVSTDALADESAVIAANAAPSAGSVSDAAAEAVAPTAPAAAEAVPAVPTAAADSEQDTAPIRSFWEAGRVLARLSGQEPQPFSTFAGGTRRYPYSQSALTDPATARTWVAALKPRLNEDLVVFRGTTRWDGEPERTDAEVVIGKSEEPFDVLRLAQTDAPGHDLSTEDIIVKLKSLDKQYGIQLYAAESDAVGFTLDRVPDDVAALAAEILALCPSAGDMGDSGKLAQHLEETQDIELRWM